jgi:hypothetical protein
MQTSAALLLPAMSAANFFHQQKGKARVALAETFAPSSAGEEVLFSIPVTSTWLHQFIMSLP